MHFGPFTPSSNPLTVALTVALTRFLKYTCAIDTVQYPPRSKHFVVSTDM